MDYEGGYSDGANDGYLSGNADKNLCVRYSSDDYATMNNKTKSNNNGMVEVHYQACCAWDLHVSATLP